MGGACCAPGRGPAEPEREPVAVAAPVRVALTDGAGAGEMVALPGGAFLMGADDEAGFPADGEGPVREVRVAAFEIDVHAVTNRRFAAFVEATGYVTDAERFGWSFVYAGFLPAELRRRSRRPEVTPWWCGAPGADWRRPEGPGSSVEDRWDHPVVHVSWADAAAFCDWAGLRLPTEAEWEYAARGGLVGARYPWGDELTPGGEHRCNIWQGRFPFKNTGEDGYLGTAPVDAYEPNGYGLYSVSGNVWEWCADWFSPDWHVTGPRRDPAGPPEGEARVMRGGSYMCHESYCNRYRVAARSSNTPDSSGGNIGFRCAR
ncbi:formylglycine-generating enzyme family protein [Streptomyces sp. 6N223]